MLANNNYKITKESVKGSLECDDFRIFKILSEKYLKYYN